MQIVVKRDPANTIRCPYIPEHLMHIESFLTHLSRCKATNKDQFKICPFNSYHVIPKYQFQQHKQKCVNRVDLDDGLEWSCRVMEKAFIAGCGGDNDPSNFKDSESDINQSLSDSSWLSSDVEIGNNFGFYQYMNKQKGEKKEREQKNRFKKQKKVDQSFSFKKQQQEDSQDESQFHKNFYDFCPPQPKYYTNQYQNHQNGYRQYYGSDGPYYYPYHNYGQQQFYQQTNFYPNREYYSNYYERQMPNYWNQQKHKPFWLKQIHRSRKAKAASYKKAKQEEQKRRKSQKADDDELLFLIDQIDRNISRNDFDNDSVSDEFGNQLAKQASFIRNKAPISMSSGSKSSNGNRKENGRNLNDQ